MGYGNASDEFLKKFTLGPLSPPDALSKIQTPVDVYGLVEYPEKLFLLAMREAFSSLDEWAWSPDLGQTNIYIRTDYPALAEGESEEVELKPAIVVVNPNVARKYQDGRRDGEQVQADAQLLTYKDNLFAPMEFHCLSKNKNEARRIAALVFAIICHNDRVFKKRGAHAILNLQMGGVTPLDIAAILDLADYPVRCTLEFTWSWARKPDGPILNVLQAVDIEDP